MSRRKHHSARHRSAQPGKARGKAVVLTLAAALTAIAVGIVVFTRSPHAGPHEQEVVLGTLPEDADLVNANVPQLMSGLAAAPPTVYPYSVVPGGVHSATEFASARAKDPVVAKHYEDISLASLRVEHVDKP